MLHIACCDDDRFWQEQFLRQLDRLLSARGTTFRIDTYNSGAALLKALSVLNAQPDLLFLDVVLGRDNGIDLAARLRQLQPELPVVLISSSAEYALPGYTVHPAHYLLKPISDQALAEALDFCLPPPQEAPSVVIRCKKAEKAVPVSEILYIEVLDTLLKLHTCSGEVYQTTGHLSQMQQRLPPGQFLRCHKSYLVNLEYVEGIRRYVLMLRNGQQIPISKKNYVPVKKDYLRYCSQLQP